MHVSGGGCRNMAARERWMEYRAISSEEEMPSESEIQKSLEMENKKKRKKNESSISNGNLLVGMVSVTQQDGIFKDPHEVGRFVGEKVGDVYSVRITRSGMVIIECKTKLQRDKALKIEVYRRNHGVRCFVLDGTVKKKGVVSGVPTSFNVDNFLNIPGVCGVRRLSRFVNGTKVDSTSVCLTVNGDLPERVFLDYICYTVRPFERAPLRCFSCQEYGHVAAVCRGTKRCAKCGGNECEKDECRVNDSEPKCLHCEGEHRVGSINCPRRKLEGQINNVRSTNKLTYAEAARRVKASGETRVTETHNDKQSNIITFEKKHFLAFMAMVINCSATLTGKSERINMILDAAKRFLSVEDITGEDLDNTLREGFSHGSG